MRRSKDEEREAKERELEEEAEAQKVSDAGPLQAFQLYFRR